MRSGTVLGMCLSLQSSQGSSFSPSSLAIEFLPASVSKDEIPISVLNKEREIYSDQARASGKPAEIINKMVEGRMDKFCKENALLEQQFVKNPNTTVKEVLTDTIAKLGENISIARFMRFQLGETISTSSKEDTE